MSFRQNLLRCFVLIFFSLLNTLNWDDQASAGQLQLAWTDNSNNEDGFRIERKTGTSGNYGEIITLGINATSYTDSGLTDGATYCYRLRRLIQRAIPITALRDARQSNRRYL